MSRRHTLGLLSGAAVLPLLAGLPGCGGEGVALNLVSEDSVRQMGLDTWQRIRAETPASDNAGYQAALQRVSRRLLAAAGQNPAEWETVVFKGGEANAFALPGKKIGVYEGMFGVARNEDQLAAVVGHEIGHVLADHSQERINTEMTGQLGLQVVSAALQVGNVAYANQIAALLGAGVQYGVTLPYSRRQELDADRFGLFNMARAGYDPEASLALWQRMQQAGGPRPPVFLSTHPAPEDRMAALREMLPEARRVARQS